MHVHASDKSLKESISAKFFVKRNGDTIVQKQGVLSDKEIKGIQDFIKENYKDMYIKWSAKSPNSYYGEKEL